MTPKFTVEEKIAILDETIEILVKQVSEDLPEKIASCNEELARGLFLAEICQRAGVEYNETQIKAWQEELAALQRELDGAKRRLKAYQDYRDQLD